MVSRSFIAILSFTGKDASRPPVFVRLIYPSWRRPLGRRELNESTEACGGSGSESPRRWRLRKGEPLFGLYKERFPHKYFVSFFIASFMRARRAEKAARRSCQSIYHFCSDLGVENAGHAAGAAGWIIDRFAPNGARNPRRAASRAAAPAGAPAACGA